MVLSIPPKEIFRAYDIRGIADKDISVTAAYQIGQAYAVMLQAAKQNEVCVARDARLSGEALEQALIDGLRISGINVTQLGVLPTPVLYFATNTLTCSNGVMVTASHNPAEYNGFKFVLLGKSLTPEQIQELYQTIVRQQFIQGTEGSFTTAEIIPDYIDYIATQVQLKRPLKIIVDAGNGMAGEIAPALYEKMGCVVERMYCDIDGRFPHHHPDPSRPENLAALQAKVQATQADIGLAFDGDADRLGVVTNAGEIIWPDRLMMFFSKEVLKAAPGRSIIFDVKCSKHLQTVITAAGGVPIMWRTGHSFLKAKVKQENAALGGEMSGHIFFNDRWFGFDDGIYAGARLLEMLSQTMIPAQEVFNALPMAIATPEINIQIPEAEKFNFIETVLHHAQSIEAEKITLDGLRLNFTDGWALMRASNTSPIIVVRFEADNSAAMQRIQSLVKVLLLSVKSDLNLPW